MTLTNFQWISTKIKDLHESFIEILNYVFFQRWTILAQKCENFHENIAFSLILNWFLHVNQ